MMRTKILNRLYVQHAITLIPSGAAKRLFLLFILQLVISLCDIMAIMLLGIVSKLGLDFSQNKIANFPEIILGILRIRTLGFEQQVAIISIVIIVLFILRTTISIHGNRKILNYLGNQAGFASKTIVEQIFRSKPEYVISRNSQEFLYGITQGIDNLTLYFLGSVIVFLTEIFFIIAILAVIVVIQPVTGMLALLIFSLATIGIHILTSEKSKQFSSQYANLSVEYNKKLLETLYLYRELFLRKREVKVTEEIQSARSASLALQARLIFLPTLSKYLFELVLILGGSIIALVHLQISDTFTTISAVTVFLAAASRVLPSLIRAQGALMAIRQSEGRSEITISQLLELEKQSQDELSTSKSITYSTEFTPDIRVSGLHFFYESSSEFSLKEISLEIQPGQFVAIVGESGSGKTTLIDLILGMLTPKSGVVEISGHSSIDAIRSWPGKIAYVPQDIIIVDGTIRRNITLLEDAEDASEQDILLALEKAHLRNDVMAMPFRLDQEVGERGIRLSGGQRQRLGIARALYTNPEIIIFDEATSSLDPITEKTVTDAIYSKKKDITLIVVAHRLSTVKNADLVVLLDKGRLVAKGTFEEVRSISPKFDEQAKLANL